MIVAALLFIVQASGAVPPPVYMTKEEEREFLSSLPMVRRGDQVFRIFSIRGTGSRVVLDAAMKKLVAEGWKCNVLTDRAGAPLLGVYVQGKGLDEIQRLISRFAAHEFGAIDAQPMLFPNPSNSN